MNKIKMLTLATVFGFCAVSPALAQEASATGAPPAPPADAAPQQDMSGPPPGIPPHGGLPGGPGGPGMNETERFQKADLNHDGFLTKDEMLEMQKSRIDKMFDEADLNHDGKLLQEELQSAVQKMRARFGQFKPGQQPGGDMPHPSDE